MKIGFYAPPVEFANARFDEIKGKTRGRQLDAMAAWRTAAERKLRPITPWRGSAAVY